MKSYNNKKDGSERMHTIKVKLQHGKYRGYFTYQVGGNCYGLDVMTNFFDPEWWTQEEPDAFKDNDCNLRYHSVEDGEILFAYDLKDDWGNIITLVQTGREIRTSIVSLKIVDCVVHEKVRGYTA